MRHYYGHRDKNNICHVRVEEDGRPTRGLQLRLDLANHSPTGFEWGYTGSGPAQLALALLADATGDDEQALRLHQRFKFAHVALWKRETGWHLSQLAIIALAMSLAEPADLSGAISKD